MDTFFNNFDLLQQIILNTPNYIFWKDTRSIYRGGNDNFAKMAGFTSIQDVIGKSDYDMPWTKQDADLYQQEDQHILLTGTSLINHEGSVTIGGTARSLSISKIPLYNNDKEIIGILGTYTDITEQKCIATQAKAEFLKNMRHDIRTPLIGIAGLANLIKTEIHDSKIKKYIEHLSTSSHTLLDLLNEILEAAKVNSREIPILHKKFELQKKLRHVIQLNQAKASAKNIQLLFDYDATIPPYLIGDPTRIHRIILELVTNALNFTNQGLVQLAVRLAKMENRNVVIKIIVEDTGIGIAPEQQQEIFLSFKRLTPSYEGIYKGAGLGLAIVKQFLDELNGEIYVESNIGKGTKFTCIFPLKKPLLEEELGCEEPLAAHIYKKMA